MRTATQEIVIYSFDDITKPENKEMLKKIIDKHCDINTERRLGEDSWYKPVYEEQIALLEQKGYYDIKISFSGFWSQGDGASFTGRIDAQKWLENNASDKFRRIKKLMTAGLIDDIIGNIKRDKYHNYVHWNTTTIYFNFQLMTNKNRSYPRIEELLEELDTVITNDHIEHNREIYTELEKFYDELTSEKQILEALKDYEFLENGNLVTELDYPIEN